MADTPKVVVEKSTVPVRTAEAVRRVLATNARGVQFQVSWRELAVDGPCMARWWLVNRGVRDP